jgi:translation initiation factor 6 (eIF-6)
LAGNKNGLLVPHTTTDQGEFDEILEAGIKYYSCFYSLAVSARL